MPDTIKQSDNRIVQKNRPEEKPEWWLRLFMTPFSRPMGWVSVFAAAVLVCWSLAIYWFYALFAILERGASGLPALLQVCVWGICYLLLVYGLKRLIYITGRGFWHYHRHESNPANYHRHAAGMYRTGMMLILLMCVLSIFYSAAVLNLTKAKQPDKKLHPNQTVTTTQNIQPSISPTPRQPNKTIDDGKTSSRAVAAGAANVTTNFTVTANPAAGTEVKKGSANDTPVTPALALWLLFTLLAAWNICQSGLFLISAWRSRSAHQFWWCKEKQEVTFIETQWQVITNILEKLKTNHGTQKQSGKAYALRGHFGSGKSFLLLQLEKCLAGVMKQVVLGTNNTPEDSMPELSHVPYVKVQVWSEETEHDLQYAILRGLMLHPAVLFSPLWHEMISLSLMLRLVSRVARKMIRQIRFKSAVVEFDVSTGVLLPWQPYLVKLANLSPQGFVVVLDEIDRAVPISAQTAMTIIKRSLDLPGITVIVPYVPAQIRYKVFNPLMCEVNDLGSSMFADIWNVLLHDDTRSITLRSLLEKDEFEKQGANTQASLGKNAVVRQKDKQLTLAELRRRMSNNLAAWYLDLIDRSGPRQYEKIVRRFEEKYLPSRIEIHPLLPKEIHYLLEAVPELKEAFDNGGIPRLEPDSVTKCCQAALDEAWGKRPGMPDINIRQFITLLGEAFDNIIRSRNDLKYFDKSDVAVEVALAYYRTIVLGNS